MTLPSTTQADDLLDDDTFDLLHKLVEDWREEARTHHSDPAANAMEQCADELLAVLTRGLQ